MKRLLIAVACGSILVGGFAWNLLRRVDEPKRRPMLAGMADERLLHVWRSIEAAARAAPMKRVPLLDAARKEMLELEANHSDDPAVAFSRGVIEVLGHREADAQTAYRQLLVAASNGARDPMSAYLRSIHVLEFDRPHAVEAVLILDSLRLQAPEFMPEPVRRALFRALVLEHYNQIDRREFERAINSISRAIGIAGTDPDLALEGRRARGFAFGQAGRWVDGERAWRDLIKDFPAAATASRFRLASALAAQSRAADADVEYSAVIDALAAGKEKADSAEAMREALLRRGNCRRLLGRFDEAKADLEAYLAVAPADYRAEYWLAVVLIDGYGKAAEAEPHALRAHTAAPWCESYLRLLVTIHEDLLPNPEQAGRFRKELDLNRAERTAKRDALVKQGFMDGLVCD